MMDTTNITLVRWRRRWPVGKILTISDVRYEDGQSTHSIATNRCHDDDEFWLLLLLLLLLLLAPNLRNYYTKLCVCDLEVVENRLNLENRLLFYIASTHKHPFAQCTQINSTTPPPTPHGVDIFSVIFGGCVFFGASSSSSLLFVFAPTAHTTLKRMLYLKCITLDRAMCNPFLRSDRGNRRSPKEQSESALGFYLRDGVSKCTTPHHALSHLATFTREMLRVQNHTHLARINYIIMMMICLPHRLHQHPAVCAYGMQRTAKTLQSRTRTFCICSLLLQHKKK